MNQPSPSEFAERLVRALQFEGYLLYPYRKSALKNRQRWAFGTLYPPQVASELHERSSAYSEVLVRGPSPVLHVSVRILRVESRCDQAPLSAHDGREPSSDWQEAKEWAFGAEFAVTDTALTQAFELAAEERTLEGRHYRQQALRGRLQLQATPLTEQLFRVRITLENRTDCVESGRELAYARSLAAPHLIVTAEGGALVSLIDPEPALAADVALCTQSGLFPVLVGPPGTQNTLLCAPTILYDYPEIAPESPGDWFDATEIDELLSLRVLTLTPAEKVEARATDPRARAILDQAEHLTPEQLSRLHGRTRSDSVRFAAGDRVRLMPKPGGDVMDLALRGEVATVCAVEQNLEGQRVFAVVVDSDPGRDLGLAGEPSHRFFFHEEDLERLS